MGHNDPGGGRPKEKDLLCTTLQSSRIYIIRMHDTRETCLIDRMFFFVFGGRKLQTQE